MNFIRSNKPDLIEVICTDTSFFLQRVEKTQLIVRREYTKLKANIDRDLEKGTIDLLDKLIDKGDETCNKFISLLKEDDTLQTFPALDFRTTYHRLLWTNLCHWGGTHTQHVKTYAMNKRPRGLCVIINNMTFKNSGERKGSDIDAGTLEHVFTWLGFTVERHNNKTVAEMENILQKCKVFGDCFICCVLSHGQSEGILGCDDEVLTMEKMLTPFKECPKLAGKPKLFFIQACRGNRFQEEVMLTTDSGEVAQELETDVRPFEMIPVDADTLIVMATVDKHYAVRDPTNGSWFIQPLCTQLKEGTLRGDDILTILTRVNDDVCQEEGFVRGKKAKQVPDQSFRLRKKLIFPVP
ncbi:caspase 20, apoptosis-related cysteine peptidase [Engraulis encrasicolus]|uniref:caspase 20, apoptosis-related cysteine peptidase n=1 Tax=Engraulis encrasicolus TaxID=184585 RepID=UPI002FD06599